MTDNPYFQIKKIKVDTFNSSNLPYSQYDVVQVPSGPASGQYLVSTTENNLTIGIPNAVDDATGSWYNFQDPDFNFADVWLPSYSTNVTNEPKVNYHQFGDGYMQRVADGINHERLIVDVVFQDSSDAEIKSLLAFFEYKGGVGKFKYTMPPPYDIEKIFICKNWRHQFVQYKRHSLNAQFVEVFDNSF